MRSSQKNRTETATCSTRSAANTAAVLALAGYVCWILAGTVAWVSHLGYRSPSIGRLLPAGGYPSNEPAHNVREFLLRNIPLALAFVLPHSLLVPHRC